MPSGDRRDAASSEPSTSEWTSRIAALHAAPHRLVFAFAGAGAETLHLLHAVPGSSRTVLEAHDLYHPASLRDALVDGVGRGSVADEHRTEGVALPSAGGAVRPEVASRLAWLAHARASAVVQGDDRAGPVLGVGLTATLVTDRSKRGDHRFHLSVVDGLGERHVAVTLEKGRRDRAGEERVVTGWTLAVTGEASGSFGWPSPVLAPGDRVDVGATPRRMFRSFLDDATSVALVDVDGRLSVVDGAGGWQGGDRPPAVLVSGSFHPMHDGHRALATAAERFLGSPTGYEMSLDNADKASIDARGAWQRAAQANGDRPMVLTHDALFVDKSERLPGTTWVVGVDTARRILESRFHASEEQFRTSMERIRAAGGKFLVAGRDVDGQYRVVNDLQIPTNYQDLFVALPDFRNDSSSTRVRATWPYEPS